jgi:hypothetical protein
MIAPRFAIAIQRPYLGKTVAQHATPWTCTSDIATYLIAAEECGPQMEVT